MTRVLRFLILAPQYLASFLMQPSLSAQMNACTSFVHKTLYSMSWDTSTHDKALML